VELHAQHLPGLGLGACGIVGEADAPSLAPATGQDLHLDGCGADFRRSRPRFFGGGDHLALGHGDAVLGEDPLRHILKQLHSEFPLCCQLRDSHTCSPRATVWPSRPCSGTGGWATPVSMAAPATATATMGATRRSQTSGMMLSGSRPLEAARSAMALAAASFISSLMSVARTSKAPRNAPGKASPA